MSYALGVDQPKQPEIEQPPTVTCPKCEAVMTFEKRCTQRERLQYLIAAPRGPPHEQNDAYNPRTTSIRLQQIAHGAIPLCSYSEKSGLPPPQDGTCSVQDDI